MSIACWLFFYLYLLHARECEAVSTVERALLVRANGQKFALLSLPLAVLRETLIPVHVVVLYVTCQTRFSNRILRAALKVKGDRQFFDTVEVLFYLSLGLFCVFTTLVK